MSKRRLVINLTTRTLPEYRNSDKEFPTIDDSGFWFSINDIHLNFTAMAKKKNKQVRNMDLTQRSISSYTSRLSDHGAGTVSANLRMRKVCMTHASSPHFRANFSFSFNAAPKGQTFQV